MTHKFLVLLVIFLVTLTASGTALADSYVQTNSVTNFSAYQATLNGFASTLLSGSNYVYFQWGQTTSYGNQTGQQNISNTGGFNQTIYNLTPGTIYHYRAVLQSNNSTFYGEDSTFTTYGGYTGNYNYNTTYNGNLSILKQAINLTTGNLNWATSVNANPSDILCLSVTLRASNGDAHNVSLKEILPVGLIYKGNLTLNSTNYPGDVTSGINIGTINNGQTAVVSYQVQVGPTTSFSYGTTSLNTSATISSNETQGQTAIAYINVVKTLIYGASDVSTGLTNNFFIDSFFLPLLLIVLGFWSYSSGRVHEFADWIKSKI